MRHSRIYIAGPMRGKPFFNFPAFDAARDVWIAKGWHVTSPADLDRFHEDFDAITANCTGFEAFPPDQFHRCMKRDIEALLDCDAVAFLPGWEHSRGANVEFQVAKAIGLDLYKVDGSPLFPEMPHVCV